MLLCDLLLFSIAWNFYNASPWANNEGTRTVLVDPLQTIFVLQESTTKLSVSTNECKITNINNTQAILHAPCTVCHLDGDAQSHHRILETYALHVNGTPMIFKGVCIPIRLRGLLCMVMICSSFPICSPFLEKGLRIRPIHPWMYTANYYKIYKERRAQLVSNSDKELL